MGDPRGQKTRISGDFWGSSHVSASHHPRALPNLQLMCIWCVYNIPPNFKPKYWQENVFLKKIKISTFFSLIIDKSQHFNKHNIQSRRIWETPLKKTFQYSDLLSQNCTESFELAKKFIKILSNPVQIWLSRNGKIQIYQNTRTRQDFNEVHVHLWSFYGHVKDISCKKLG